MQLIDDEILTWDDIKSQYPDELGGNSKPNI